MEDVIELHHWNAFKFGTFEYRLCGYITREGQLSCIVSEPIRSVDAQTGIVETVNSVRFKPLDVIETSQKIDMMYVIGRWCDLNVKGQPGEAANTVLESLGRIKKE
jgi:hypothetical protein